MRRGKKLNGRLIHNDLQRVQTLQKMSRQVKGDTLQGFCDKERVKGWRAKNGQSEGRVKNNWRYADKALKLIGDDKNVSTCDTI